MKYTTQMNAARQGIVTKEMEKEAKKADTVWLASDEDREGEAISWHLSEVLKLDPEKTKRIVFHEITKPAIQNAIEHPRTINLDLVDAQQARRVLDRIVGFELSPVLWRKIKPSLSAGRVQSVTVRLIVEKEIRQSPQRPVQESFRCCICGEYPGNHGSSRIDRQNSAYGLCRECRNQRI